MAQEPIELFYWPTPNGWKVAIALEEMGLPYAVRPVNIAKGEQFEPAFLAISPNNRMPAITDPHGPGGRPISIFESGAILQYLGRKTGLFYPEDERGRVEVDQWIMWQVGGLGPMAGQANHFRNYAATMVSDPALLAYGRDRYTNEVNRLFGVMERRLADRDYLAGAYSLADMMSYPWVTAHAMMGQNLEDFPRLKTWFDAVAARPKVKAGLEVGKELRLASPNLADKNAEAERKILFGQTAQNGAPTKP